MLKMVNFDEESWRVREKLSKVEKVKDELGRDVKGSRTRKARPPPMLGDSLERGWLNREYPGGVASQRSENVEVERIHVSVRAKTSGRAVDARSNTAAL